MNSNDLDGEVGEHWLITDTVDEPGSFLDLPQTDAQNSTYVYPPEIQNPERPWHQETDEPNTSDDWLLQDEEGDELYDNFAFHFFDDLKDNHAPPEDPPLPDDYDHQNIRGQSVMSHDESVQAQGHSFHHQGVDYSSSNAPMSSEHIQHSHPPTSSERYVRDHMPVHEHTGPIPRAVPDRQLRRHLRNPSEDDLYTFTSAFAAAPRNVPGDPFVDRRMNVDNVDNRGQQIQFENDLRSPTSPHPMDVDEREVGQGPLGFPEQNNGGYDQHVSFDRPGIHRETIPEEMNVDEHEDWEDFGTSARNYDEAETFESSHQRNNGGGLGPSRSGGRDDTISELERHLNEQREALIRLHRSLERRLSELMARLEHVVEHRQSLRRRAEQGTPEKDSSGNYFRGCIRAHVKLRLGFCATQRLPDRPPQNVIAREISRINNGEDPHNPFLADLGDTLSSDWNRCVEKYFYCDFWESVNAHIYQGTLIPDHFRHREAFAAAYHTHMLHLKKAWQEQQQPLDPAKAEGKRKHSTRNSRMGTTYRNRRDAVAILPPPLAGPLVRLVEAIGTTGISSDEEISGVRPCQYNIFEKPWRSDALCHLYRHLDLIHAANRNPNGNPIRTRHRTMRTRHPIKPPKGLPRDCLNVRYLDQLSLLEREFLQMTGDVGVERLLAEVQRFGI